MVTKLLVIPATMAAVVLATPAGAQVYKIGISAVLRAMPPPSIVLARRRRGCGRNAHAKGGVMGRSSWR